MDKNSILMLCYKGIKTLEFFGNFKIGVPNILAGKGSYVNDGQGQGL